MKAVTGLLVLSSGVACRTGVGALGCSRRPSTLARWLASRSRGLPSSSIPVLSRTSEVPIKATARPGGTNHHQAPSCSASWLSCPVQDGAEAPGGRVRQADEGQRHRRTDRVEHGVDEVGRDEADLVRDDLEGDDPPAALARLAGGGDEVATADRQRLGPDHPCAKGPAQPGEHQDGCRLPGPRQVAEQDDQQRQRGDHQEHVADQRQHLVPDTAEVGARSRRRAPTRRWR